MGIGLSMGQLYHNISGLQRVRWKGSEEIFDQDQIRCLRKLFSIGNKTFDLPLGLDQFKSIATTVLPHKSLHLAGQNPSVKPHNDPEVLFCLIVQDQQYIHNYPRYQS